MDIQTDIEFSESIRADDKLNKLELLRRPFPKNKISKLPKPTKQQTEQVKVDFNSGIRCIECGGWHHPRVAHLDYVGHATVNDRFLEVDPRWNWEPLSLSQDGLPAFDKDGGLWIKLTICGITRLGYGDAQGKTGGDAVKEKIGDALRNAAMRFGVALDLWAKIDLHQSDEEKPIKQRAEPKEPREAREHKESRIECTKEKFDQMCVDVISGDTGEIERMGWKSLVQSGSKSSDHLIKQLSTKYVFSAEQLNTIESWGTPKQ